MSAYFGPGFPASNWALPFVGKCPLENTSLIVRHEGVKGKSNDQLKLSCCTRDEGRSLGVGMQVQAPNRPELLWSRAMVVSVVGKGAARLRQV